MTILRPPTRTAIIEAAFEIFSRDPSASLSEVSERAGVGRATLHRHFPSRDALVRALALIAIEEMDAAADAATAGAPNYTTAFQRMLSALIPLGSRHGFLALEPIEGDPEIADAFARQQRETSELIDACKAEGLFELTVPTDWISQVFDHLLYAAWESIKAGETTPKQASDLAWRTLTRGLSGQANDL
ncbi:MAG: helix-turn-helix domain-containing protein [Pseudomonadota bacterium]